MEEMTDEMAEEVSEPKSELELQSIVKFAVEDAIDFIESEISDVRNKCQRYMEGGTDLGHEEGRSKVVADHHAESDAYLPCGGKAGGVCPQKATGRSGGSAGDGIRTYGVRASGWF